MHYDDLRPDREKQSAGTRRVWAARQASTVERCHIVRHLGSYTVGQHSHGVAVLISLLNPSPSVALLQAALFHDMAERWTGDIPANVLRDNIDLLDHVKQMEDRLLQDKFGVELNLSEEETQWLVGCDKLELLFWAMEQQSIGNKYAKIVEFRCRNYLYKSHIAGTLPNAIWAVVQERPTEETQFDV